MCTGSFLGSREHRCAQGNPAHPTGISPFRKQQNSTGPQVHVPGLTQIRVYFLQKPTPGLSFFLPITPIHSPTLQIWNSVMTCGCTSLVLPWDQKLASFLSCSEANQGGQRGDSRSESKNQQAARRWTSGKLA